MDVQELKQRLKGQGVITMTPFKDNLEIDFNGIMSNTEHMIQHGTDFIVSNSSVSETRSMSVNEIKEVMTAHIKAVKNRIPILPSIVRDDFKSCVEMAQHAQSAGADGIMVLIPNGYGSSQDSVYNYYRNMQQEVDMPVLLYYSESIKMNPALIRRLLSLGNICGKITGTSNLSNFRLEIELLADELACLGSNEDNALYYYILGSPGTLTVSTNFAPEMLKQIQRLIQQEELKEAVAQWSKFLPFRRLMRGVGTTPVTKAAMTVCGLTGGRVRPPLKDAPKELYKELEKVFQSWGIL